jgi:V8-like Glu-specific endopeptidase
MKIRKNTFFFIFLFSSGCFSNIETPTVAKIFGRNGESCMASFISIDKIITAAHCNLSSYKYKDLQSSPYESDKEKDETDFKNPSIQQRTSFPNRSDTNANKGHVIVNNKVYTFKSEGRLPNQYNSTLDFSINKIIWKNENHPRVVLIKFNRVKIANINDKLFSKILSNEGQYIITYGLFMGLAPKNNNKDRYKFHYSIQTTFGHSGAPIFDEHNNLLSIVSGGLQNNNYNYGPFVNDILDALKK